MSTGPGSREPAPGALTEEDLVARILALPEVTQVVADEESGAPEVSWGNRFFFVGPPGRTPFATIVASDVPGFDEASRLDRAGVFRLNVFLGRREFQRRFGFPPADLPGHLADYDFTRPDVVLPHPAYGTYGLAGILNPSRASLPEVDRLLAHAHRRERRRPSR